MHPRCPRRCEHTRYAVASRTVLADARSQTRTGSPRRNRRLFYDGRALHVGYNVTLGDITTFAHEVEALEDSIVLDVFSPVRVDWLRGDDAYLRST